MWSHGMWFPVAMWWFPWTAISDSLDLTLLSTVVFAWKPFHVVPGAQLHGSNLTVLLKFDKYSMTAWRLEKTCHVYNRHGWCVCVVFQWACRRWQCERLQLIAFRRRQVATTWRSPCWVVIGDSPKKKTIRFGSVNHLKFLLIK